MKPIFFLSLWIGLFGSNAAHAGIACYGVTQTGTMVPLYEFSREECFREAQKNARGQAARKGLVSIEWGDMRAAKSKAAAESKAQTEAAEALKGEPAAEAPPVAPAAKPTEPPANP